MFTVLRYIALLSFLAVVGGAGFLTYFAREYKEAELEEVAKQELTATLSSYTVTIWDRYGPELKNPATPYKPNFIKETERFFEKHPLLKVTIFSPSVRELYYPDANATPKPVKDANGKDVYLFDEKNFNDKMKNVLIGMSELRTLYHTNAAGLQDRTLVQAVFPLIRSNTTIPDALVEVYIDVTDRVAQLNKSFAIFMGSIVIVSALLIGVVILTTIRAEGIISKQHEVNLELIAAAAEAEAKSRDKSQFLASISHELRTPLNAVIGFSDIIRNEAKDKLEKVHQEYVDDINASGRHLLSLINDILDFSKAEAGKLQIEWAETDVTKTIRNSLRMVMPRAEAAQVTLVEDIPSQHLVIVTDPKKLKQVLLNLLSNAVKFTPAGGEVRCHAWVEVVSGALNIQVRDTGIGIAPKDISRVMTPFGQVDSALSRKYEGTGLGLPLSKKFVESMGGSFAIESQLKVGTSVTITLPKAPPGWGTPAMSDSPQEKEAPHVAHTHESA